MWFSRTYLYCFWLNYSRSPFTILQKQNISDFEAGRSSETKRKLKHNFNAVNEPLLKWFWYARDEKIPVSGEMLLEGTRVCTSSWLQNIEKLDMNWRIGGK